MMRLSTPRTKSTAARHRRRRLLLLASVFLWPTSCIPRGTCLMGAAAANAARTTMPHAYSKTRIVNGNTNNSYLMYIFPGNIEFERHYLWSGISCLIYTYIYPPSPPSVHGSLLSRPINPQITAESYRSEVHREKTSPSIQSHSQIILNLHDKRTVIFFTTSDTLDSVAFPDAKALKWK